MLIAEEYGEYSEKKRPCPPGYRARRSAFTGKIECNLAKTPRMPKGKGPCMLNWNEAWATWNWRCQHGCKPGYFRVGRGRKRRCIHIPMFDPLTESAIEVTAAATGASIRG